MLLSFAQFEREVTGERIRDKLAASKRKGMWMGGVAPLGYLPEGRTLRIVEEEAATVRHIFQRYLELGSVHALRDELKSQGVVSKRRTYKDGREVGGAPMDRGALYHLLYVGEIVHKDETHPGLHPALIDAETFEAVQRKLAANRRRPRASKAKLPCSATPLSFLTGLVRDDVGAPMTPSHTKKDGVARYRYYVSCAAQTANRTLVATLRRAPAGPLEDLVLDRGRRLGLLPDGEDARSAARTALERVEVGREQVRMVWRADPRSPPPDEMRLAPHDLLMLERGRIVLEVATRVQVRGGSRAIRGPASGGAVDAPAHDLTLIKALVRAESWRKSLVSNDAASIDALASAESLKPGYARRMLRLAFLAPDLKAAILDGSAPPALSLQKVMTQGLPESWSEQRRFAAA